MSANKYTRKPKTIHKAKESFKAYNLSDNPFPYDPFIEPESGNDRVNGTIYNEQIKSKEINRITEMFLNQEIDGNHRRLGYLVDSSYTGRGNGKSAFLVHMLKEINNDAGERLSQGLNKVFAVYVKPKSGGFSAKYWQFCDEVIRQMCKLNVIEDCMLTLYLQSIEDLSLDINNVVKSLTTEGDFLAILDPTWLEDNGMSHYTIWTDVRSKLVNQGLGNDQATKLANTPVKASDYILLASSEQHDSWKKKNIANFLFDDLVRLFITADYNGAYILLDEFEKIAEYQNLSERNDFANGLRENLFDGGMQSAIHGFFMNVIAMHPGTPNVVSDAWEKSGLNARAPLPLGKGEEEPHILFFHNVSKDDVPGLLEVYLDHYRIDKTNKEKGGLFPFDKRAITKIAEHAGFNIAKTLRFANIACTELVAKQGEKIDTAFVNEFVDRKKGVPSEDISSPDFLHREKAPMEESLKGIKGK